MTSLLATMTHYDYNKDKQEVTLRGIPYSDFDHTGHWAIWKVLKCLESAIDITNTGLRDDKNLISYAVHIILKLNMDLHSDICYYTKIHPKLAVKLDSIGKSSFVLYVSIVDDISGKMYAESFIKSVSIEKKSGKVAAVPQWFIQKHEINVKGNKEIYESLDTRSFPNSPSSVYKMTTKLRPSDTDLMGHTNNTVYIMLCVDCATCAAVAGFYKHYNSDMCHYPVLDVDVQYLHDCRTNDSVTVTTWQDNENEQKIYFVISLNEKQITTACFKFGLRKSENVDV